MVIIYLICMIYIIINTPSLPSYGLTSFD